MNNAAHNTDNDFLAWLSETLDAQAAKTEEEEAAELLSAEMEARAAVAEAVAKLNEAREALAKAAELAQVAADAPGADWTHANTAHNVSDYSDAIADVITRHGVKLA